MVGDLPIVENKFSVFVMKYPTLFFDPVPINFNIQGNKYIAFVPTVSTLTANRTVPGKTLFSGFAFFTV